MSTAVLEKSLEQETSSESSICHFYCLDCYPEADVAFCGSYLTDDIEVFEDEVDCVVCVDLEWCPICGSWEDDNDTV